jgi:hypothetical protein
MNVETKYTYEALLDREIRLLYLTYNGEQIVSKLIPCSISNPLRFTALSYAWGSPSRQNDLTIDESTLKITKSVHDFLPYLRRHLGTEYVWIDGVCINQDNDNEKTAQVPLMGEIYTKATEAIIWLGPSDDDIDAALNAIPLLNAKLGGIEGRLATTALNNALVDAGLPPVGSPVWKGFTKLYSRSWFSRLWTFQEAILPKHLKLMCGNNIVPFDMFESFTTILRSTYIGRLAAQDQILGPSIAVAYTKIGTIALGRNNTAGFRSLPILVEMARHWSVTNPLDRIYGMLGLVDDNIKVSYSLSPASLYSAFVMKHLKSNRELSLLNAASSTPPMRGLPSWCPNFDAKAKTATLGGVAANAEYSAGKGPKSQFDYPIDGDENSRTLYIRGIQVDVVGLLVPSTFNKFHQPGSPPKPIPSYNFEWMEACLLLSQNVLKEHDTVPESHWRTLIANKDSDNKRYHIDGKKYFDRYRIVLARGSNNQEFEDSHKDVAVAFDAQSSVEDLEMGDYVRALTYACQKRRFFSTKEGRIGLGPSSTRPGDLICILYNGVTPFILRSDPRPDVPEANTLVGEAYVHGLMYGEYLDWETRPEDQVFVLH